MFLKCKLFASFPFAIYYTILFHQSYMDFLFFFTFLVFSANLNVPECIKQWQRKGY